jgi:hypothetical protein
MWLLPPHFDTHLVRTFQFRKFQAPNPRDEAERSTAPLPFSIHDFDITIVSYWPNSTTFSEICTVVDSGA